jgi:hypothetical protein
MGFFLFFSCENPSGSDGISYPYTEHEIEYLGFKSGLSSSSSAQAFNNGLNEVLQTYLANHPNSSNEFAFDGITYEFTNLQDVTMGGIPNYVWDNFWNDLKKYSYSVGSCFGYVYTQIPSKGGTGTVYVLYTIINSMNDTVLYKAVKGNVKPTPNRMIYAPTSPNRSVYVPPPLAAPGLQSARSFR